MITRLLVTVVKGKPVRVILDGLSDSGNRSILNIPRDLYGSDAEFYDAVRHACLSGGAPDAKDKPGQ